MSFDQTIKSALENHRAGNLQKAEFIYKNILIKRPNDVDALHLLGVLRHQLGDYDSAITYIRKAIEIDIGFAEGYNNLGNVIRDMGQIDEAEIYYQKALQIDPNFAIAYNNLGNIYTEKKLPDKAIFFLNKALQIDPNFAEALSNLGKVLDEIEHFDEAIACCQKAIQINPNYANAYYNLGTIFFNKGHLSEAISCYQEALRRKPLFAEAFNNLGNAFKDKGQQNEAEQCYKKALQLNNDHSAYSNLLLTMNYNLSYNPHRIYSEHVLFAKQFAEPFHSEIFKRANDHISRRRLKIGYVSPDFRKHSVAYFSEPVFINHNSDHFEVFCYSNSLKHDEVTKRIQDHTDQWHNITGMSDKEVAGLIRKDQIDILVDLAGHTAQNRILVFAQKPAPIQVSWIGYPATTGLSTMDYKIVDNYTDPLGMTENFYTEQLIRMPESFLCYLPDSASPEVGALPSLTSSHVTFGSFNNFPKITPEVVRIWGEILKAIPDSYLVLKAKSFSDEMTRDYALQMFFREGIEGYRIKLYSWAPSTKEHLSLYNQIDIALDTFPFNGTTTTCEALWMGVPVITFAGAAHASRVGASLLSNVGLKELIACTQAEYIDIAVKLASDIKRVQTLREKLRGMMAHSPLTDDKRFTANLEICYRHIWEEWCSSV
jgi:protein O-GlcNAc transferase